MSTTAVNTPTPAPIPKPASQTVGKAAGISSTPEDRKDPAVDEPKAEPEKPKAAAKTKPSFGLSKADAKAAPKVEPDPEEEVVPEAEVVEEAVNTMAGDSSDEVEAAPAPRGIFAKVSNGS
jgi:hypothetical protein